MNWKKITSGFEAGAIVVIGVLTIISLLLTLPLKTPVKPFIVTSGSMRPKIWEGSIVFVRRGYNDLKINDIITFIKPDNFKDNVTHRIIGEEKKNGQIFYQTRGDANNTPDSWLVRQEAVWGRVLFHIPLFGFLISFSRTRLGAIIVFVIPAIFIVISELLNMKKELIALKTRKTLTVLLLFFFSFNLFAGSLSTFTTQASASQNKINTSCWVNPTPDGLLSPATDTVTPGTDIDFSWTAATSSCPDAVFSYRLEIFSDSSLATLVYQSSWQAGLTYNHTLSADDYWWRVEVKDQYDKYAYTSVYHLTIDTSRPSSSIGDTSVTITNDPDFDITANSADDNGVDFVQLCYSHNLNLWICDPALRETPLSPVIFHFTSPQGDGLYRFVTVAHDLAGNVEDNNSNGVDDDSGGDVEFESLAIYSVLVDTTPPTTNADISDQPENKFLGQNLLAPDWNITQGEGDHHLVSVGENLIGDTFFSPSGGDMYLIGYKDSPLADNVDSIYQLLSLPQNASTNLSFWFRSISDDTVDYDQFRVEVRRPDDYLLQTILTTGSLETGGSNWTADSGWRHLTQSLIAFAGQTIKLWFGQSNVGPKRSWTYLEAIQVNTLDLRVGETFPVLADAHDSGSGIGTTQLQPIPAPGENNLGLGSTDIAGNSESPDNLPVIVAPNVVLNKIRVGASGVALPCLTSNPLSVELFNNSLIAQNLTTFYLQNSSGQTIPITATNIGATDSLSVSFDYDGLADTISLFQIGNTASLDQTTFINNNGTVGFWQRSPNGVGTWSLQADPSFVCNSIPLIDFNLVSRPLVNKITLTISNIPIYNPNDADFLQYDITYTSISGPQQISGIISPDTITNIRTIDRDFYLGTCSSGGACAPDAVAIGSTISVDVTGKISQLNIARNRIFVY